MSGSFTPSTAGIQAALPGGAQTNPLQQLSTLAGIQNTQVLNKLYQQDILNKQQELTNAQTSNQGALFDQANASIDRYAAATMGVLAKSDLSGQGGFDAIKAAADTELANHPNNPVVQKAHDNFMAAVPPPTQADGTPTSDATYRQFEYQHGQLLLSARERIAALQRPLSYQNTQAGPVPFTGPSDAEKIVNPGAQLTFNMGNGPQTGMIPQGVAPSLQQVFVPDPGDPTGKTGAFHFQAVYPGAPPLNAPPGAAQPLPPVVPAVPPTGAVPAANAPVPGAPPAANVGPLAGAPMGASEQVQENVKAYQGDASKIQSTWNTLRIAQQARSALQLANTGRGTQDWYNLGQTLQSWGWIPDGSEWAKQINNQAEAVKLTAQLVSNNSNFGGSDARLAEGLKGSATTGIPNSVSENIIRDNIIAPARMFLAQVQQTTDPRSYTGGAAPGINSYASHSGNFSMSMGSTGQLAYEWDMLKPEEQQAVMTQLDKNPTVKKNFLTHLGIAQRYFFPDYKPTQPQQ